MEPLHTYAVMPFLGWKLLPLLSERWTLLAFLSQPSHLLGCRPDTQSQVVTLCRVLPCVLDCLAFSGLFTNIVFSLDVGTLTAII